MLKEAFDGREPLVVSQNSGNDQEFRSQPYAFIIGNSIDKNFDISNSGLTKVSFFSDKNNLSNVDVSTDNWPFFICHQKFGLNHIFIIFLIFISSFFSSKIQIQ